MTTCHDCGCESSRCGCCDGITTLTPVGIANRPGLPALAYRVGTHGRFYASMRARLPLIEIVAPGADHQTLESFRPLRALTTRDPADPAIALLDAWATVADVLTFYQERIANEGYLRTATERRSLLELSRLVGYAPRAGVSSSVFLSYTVDDNQADPVEIPAGSRSQSIPSSGEQPQSFETSEPLMARREWNDLQVRRRRPQDVALGVGGQPGTVATVATVYVAGTSTGVQPGDLLLFRFGRDDASAVHWVRKVARAEADFAGDRTAITLQPLHWLLLAALPRLHALIPKLEALHAQGDPETAITAAKWLLESVRLGLTPPPLGWTEVMLEHIDTDENEVRDELQAFHDELFDLSPDWLLQAALPLLRKLVVALVPAAGRDGGAAEALQNARDLLAGIDAGTVPPVRRWPERVTQNTGIEDHEAMRLIAAFEDAIDALFDGPVLREPTDVASPDEFADSLLEPPVPQAANALSLPRGLGQAFARGADLQPQMLIDFAPRMKDSYYAAWRGARPSEPTQGLDSVHVLRGGELLFGAGAGREPAFDSDGNTRPPPTWNDWNYAADETETNAFLGRPDDVLGMGDLVMLQQPTGIPEAPYMRTLRRVASTVTAPRNEYGISGDSTMIEFGPPGWRQLWNDKDRSIATLRGTRLHPQKARLALVEEPILSDVSGQEIELGPLHEALASGRWVVLEGERSDIDGVDGVRVSELMMIAGLVHGYDPALPGDRAHTTLRLATATAYAYKRDTLRIHANVVAASHGETRADVLGSGDASKPMQTFELRQPPLTWRPAPTAAGATSTLKVLVNDVEWTEVDSLAGLGPHDRAFVTRTGEDDRTAVIFGNGVQGARPPTGFENIRAEYRAGIGKGGNVRGGQVAMMIHRALGVKDVVNPLAASGGADRESPGLIRENAPRSIIALDRLVSVSDYADFTRMYAGIAKADAVKLSDGTGERVHITVAGVDDMAIEETSDLYRNLLASLRRLGDPGLRVQVSMRERITLVLEARIRLQEGHRWEPVATAARALLLERFGFASRALGQPALLCEVIAALQSVRGVAWVDVDSFGGVPEKVDRDRGGRRTLITQDEITRAVAMITGSYDGGGNVTLPGFGGDRGGVIVTGPARGSRRPAQGVEARRAEIVRGLLRPTQLAIFSPAIPDTLILNPIPDPK